MEEGIDVERNLMIRGVRKLFPVETSGFGGRWFIRREGRLHTTPIFLCFVGLVFTDIIFAIDSIPAAFAITRDSFVIWSANVFALLGLRALIVLVDRLIERFRYLDQTIAVVLGVIALKLILEEAGAIHISALASLGIVAAIFAIGITLSILGEDEADEGPGDGQVTPGPAA
jgi:tellurite resistance protein TerC